MKRAIKDTASYQPPGARESASAGKKPSTDDQRITIVARTRQITFDILVFV
jgi:hypothetical protein